MKVFAAPYENVQVKGGTNTEFVWEFKLGFVKVAIS